MAVGGRAAGVDTRLAVVWVTCGGLLAAFGVRYARDRPAASERHGSGPTRGGGGGCDSDAPAGPRFHTRPGAPPAASLRRDGGEQVGRRVGASAGVIHAQLLQDGLCASAARMGGRAAVIAKTHSCV